MIEIKTNLLDEIKINDEYIRDNLQKLQNKIRKAIKFEKQLYPCNSCDYIANQKGHLKRHWSTVHERNKVYCDLCDKSFTLITSLQRHVDSVHASSRLSLPRVRL